MQIPPRARELAIRKEPGSVQLQQVTQNATNPAKCNCNKSCNVQLEQILQYATHPAICNCNRSCKMQRILQSQQVLQYTTHPAICNCIKSCNTQALQNVITANPAKGNRNKSRKRRLQQILPEATNPAILIATNPAIRTKSRNIQLHQMTPNATSPAIRNGNKPRNVNCNKPCKMQLPQILQNTTNPAKCNCNKTCSIPSQQNPGAVWRVVGWHGASQIFAFHPTAAPAASPDRLHPLKSEAKLHQLGRLQLASLLPGRWAKEHKS